MVRRLNSVHNLRYGWFDSTEGTKQTIWKSVIIGSRPVLKTGGRESGLRVRVPRLPQVFEIKCFGPIAQSVRAIDS